MTMTIAPSYVLKTDFVHPAFRPYGGNKAFVYCRDPEVIVSGPTDTGKTLAACWKLHILACKYPGAQFSMLRKTQKSLYGSVLQTFDRVIKGAPVEPYGGEKPEKYLYANGSTVWVGGMDNPDKILSSERDVIYVNQAEELSVNDWEMLTTRSTGRSAVVPYPQLMGDCNPGPPLHWIRRRSQAGVLTLLTTVHQDNPTLYDPITHEITSHGARVMARLNNLTGIRRKRLLEGIWAVSEGAVYDAFDRSVHVLERDSAEFQQWFLALDEGYTNPAVILLVGQDSDGRLHIAQEFYQRGVLQGVVVQMSLDWANRIFEDSRARLLNVGITDEKELARLASQVVAVVVDQSAAGLIADLRDVGLPAHGVKGRVRDGIASIQGRLTVAGDGRPRLTMDPSCVETINEFESYIWKPDKDEPVKEHDHAVDAVRYLDEELGGGYGGDLVAWV